MFKQHRLKGEEIKIILKHGKIIFGKFFNLKFSNRQILKFQDETPEKAGKIKGLLKNNPKIVRFAVIVSKKLDKRSTRRNLIKRRIKEAVRLNLDRIKRGVDLVFLTKPEIIGRNYKEIENEILCLLKKL